MADCVSDYAAREGANDSSSTRAKTAGARATHSRVKVFKVSASSNPSTRNRMPRKFARGEEEAATPFCGALLQPHYEFKIREPYLWPVTWISAEQSCLPVSNRVTKTFSGRAYLDTGGLCSTDADGASGRRQ